jgi:hypothetical protein
LTLELLTASFPDPSVFSEPFFEFLDKPLEVEPLRASRHEIATMRRRLLKERGRVDSLIRLFREWAAAELAPRKRGVLSLATPVRSLLDEPWRYRRYLLAVSLKEIASLIANGYTPRELVALATRGDKQSLMCLVELDKMFLTARFSREWFVSAQSRRDTRFFKRLATSVERDTLKKEMPSARLGIACYLLWFLGFERVGKKRLLSFIESEGLAEYPDPHAFYKYLSRLGIKVRAK